MIPRRRTNPAIPGTPKDRTGAAGLLRRAYAAINKRFSGLQADVLAIFDRIPVYGLNDLGAAQVMYGLSAEELAATAQALQDALDRWIVSSRESASVMWWAPYDQEAAQLGSAQSYNNISALSPSYAASRSLQQIIFSAPYANRVALAQVKSYESWTGLAAGMRSELSQIIGRAVVDGKNPKAVRSEIMDRLDVSKSRAMLYAQTDITDTLRQARWAEADYATETMGLNIGLLWTSALLPTTRPWHASRNGSVYTSKEVKDFYAERGNRFACHCSTTEALLDSDNKPILTDTLKTSMRKERDVWEAAHGHATKPRTPDSPS